MNQLATNAPTLVDLAGELQTAKINEKAAKARRLEVEQAILDHGDIVGNLKDEGTTTIGPMKIVNKFTRKWDDKQVVELARQIAPEYFPFRPKYVEDKKLSDAIAERFPELWDKLRPALTLMPAKAAISIVTPKEVA